MLKWCIYCGCFTFSLNPLWLTWPRHFQTHHANRKYFQQKYSIIPRLIGNIIQILDSLAFWRGAWSLVPGRPSLICHLNTFHALAFWRLRTRWSLKLGSRSFVPRPLPNPLQTGGSSKHHQFTTGNCSTLLLSTLQYIANLVLHLRRPRVFPSTVVWSAMRPKNEGRLSCFILLRYSLIGVYWNHLNVHSTPNFVLRKD